MPASGVPRDHKLVDSLLLFLILGYDVAAASPGFQRVDHLPLSRCLEGRGLLGLDLLFKAEDSLRALLEFQA